MLRRTEKLLKSKNVETTRALEKYSRAKHKKVHSNPKAITNPSIDDPVVGSPEVEAKVTSQPLQLQVHKEVSKVKRLTRSSTKKETSSKGKDIVTIDLDLVETKSNPEQSPSSPMTDNTPDPQRLLESIGTQPGTLTLTKGSPITRKDPAMPKW